MSDSRLIAGNRLWLAVVEDGMRHRVTAGRCCLLALRRPGSGWGGMRVTTERGHRGGPGLAMVCGAVAVLVVAGCASAAKSPSPVPATAQSLPGFTWSAAPAPPLSPRFAHASVWTGTEFLIWGGVQDNQGQPE